MSIATELTRIINAKNYLKYQLLNKGIQVNSEKIDEYQYFVDAVHSPFPAVTHPYIGDANLDLVRLQYAKDALKESINNKGGTITNELISDYYNKLENITYTPRLTRINTLISRVNASSIRNIWTDGTRILDTYNGTTENHLTGEIVTWNGNNIPRQGYNIWSDSVNIYYDGSDGHYKYNPSLNEWENNTWSINNLYGETVWVDESGNIFSSYAGYGNNQLVNGDFVPIQFYDNLGNILTLEYDSQPVNINNTIYCSFNSGSGSKKYKKTGTYTWTEVYNYSGNITTAFTINGEIYRIFSDYTSIFHESTLRFERVINDIFPTSDSLFSINPQKNIRVSAFASTFGQDRNVSPSDVYANFGSYFYQYAISDTPAKTTDFVEYSTITNTPSGNVNAFWSDGINVYNSNNSSSGKVFNKNTNTWDSITWNKSIDGNRIWTDGVDIYCDYNNLNNHYKLNRSTMQWEDHTWNISNLDGSNVWTLNGEYYYDGGVYSSKLNKSTMQWEDRHDTNGIGVGYGVWTDGKRVFYSNGSGSSNQKELTINSDNTFTWTNKTWNGLSGFYAYQSIWTDGTNIYYDRSTNHKMLDLATDTWVDVTWSNVNPGDRYIYSINPNKNFLALLKAKTFTQDRNIHPEDIIVYSGNTNYQLQKL